MKFVKGLILGGMVTAGITMMWNAGMMNKKRLAKKGRQFARKIGIW